MATRLIDTDWGSELTRAAARDASSLRVIAPFIKIKALGRLLAAQPASVRVITRFSLQDFASGVSDLAALEVLLARGAKVRGVRHLHAKLYLFGQSQAIVTSANLTAAALDRNHEFGLWSDETEVIGPCEAYFARLWERGGPDLTLAQMRDWRDQTAERLSRTVVAEAIVWPDYGADLGLAPPLVAPTAVTGAAQAFVKFLGEGDNRVDPSVDTLEEVERSGAHWALGYPAGKRPRQVRDGDIMFIGRLTRDPHDIMVFGRAIAQAHVEGRDDATPAEIAQRPWKETWSRYIRVHDAAFVAGPLANGVSLNGLMKGLESDAFASTQRNRVNGGNTEPRRAYSQQPAVRLSEVGLIWLSEALEAQFQRHGIIPRATLDELDLPEPALLA